MASKNKYMVILAALVVFGAIFVVPGASAASNPFLKAWKHQPGAQVGVSEASSKSTVIVLAYNSFKKGTEVNSPKCHWANGENSGETATGEVFWFYDTHMWVCPNKEAPYGWVKVKGGMTGAHCYNAVKLNTPPKPKLKIVLVRTFGKFKAVANAHARESVHGSCGVAEATATAHGMAYGMTRVQAKGNARTVANAKAQASAYAKAQVALVCSPQPSAPPAVKPPEVPKPPAEIICEFEEVKNAAGNCVKQENKAEQHCQAVGGTWNGSQQLCTIIQINANCSNVTVVNGSGNVVETKQEGNCNQEIKEEHPCGCTPPEEPPSILITSTTNLNQVEAGRNSGPFYIGVNASKAGGSLTIDPGIGSVSKCGSSTEEVSLTLSVPAGASEQCVIFYAPEDGDKPTEMTVTMTAVLGSAHDQKEQTFKITYPQRPE